ncbi:hypothetical protein NHL50_06185 [Acidimicrobiia bacterium EGI L10123]|uniref:hypothetical protein n=1 Tax=Salinilacustrithrix flava TaxID=2957203 RepID=UPI003D7C25E7|nr:hypothetical protein [Acidimicrobiia bacterium EGI L10123]
MLRVQLDDGHLVDLHPAVSVVSGLSEPQRATLRQAFDAIASGLEPALPALIEAHGLLLDATQADLDLLEVQGNPVGAVVTGANVDGDLPGDAATRLRTAERDVVLLSSDRWEACDELARSEIAAARPSHGGLRARAAALRAGIARHEAVVAEPVRAALDEVRDRRRAGAPTWAGDLVEALAGVGIDVDDLGLPVGELVRIAEDWLEERRIDVGWAVGAGVELAAIEAALAFPEPPSGGAEHDLDAPRARASRATAAHAEAIVRLDAVRAELTPRGGERPSVQDLGARLSARLADHRPTRLAGAVPLLLDGALGHLDDADVTSLLDRLAAAAGAVQVVVVDEHPAAVAWARSVGPRRAAHIEPVPRRSAAAPT